MKKLEKLNSHKRDSRINFNEKEHSYTIDDQEKAISVTQLIHEFFPKFNKNYWAERESNKTGESKDDILSRWEELGSKARNLGTELHNQIENYYNKASKISNDGVIEITNQKGVPLTIAQEEAQRILYMAAKQFETAYAKQHNVIDQHRTIEVAENRGLDLGFDSKDIEYDPNAWWQDQGFDWEKV